MILISLLGKAGSAAKGVGKGIGKGAGKVAAAGKKVGKGVGEYAIDETKRRAKYGMAQAESIINPEENISVVDIMNAYHKRRSEEEKRRLQARGKAIGSVFQ
jgi:hypothetical protein